MSLFHLNSKSFKSFDDFIYLLAATNNFNFSFMGITETWLTEAAPLILFTIEGYNLVQTNTQPDGVAGLDLLKHNYKYKL